MNTKQETDVRYSCSHCTKRYTSHQRLVEHIRSVHEKLFFSCEHCAKKFSRKDTLKLHLKSHTESSAYVCDICKKTFLYVKTLQQHVINHNSSPNKCDKCGKHFVSRSSLGKHLKICNQ